MDLNRVRIRGLETAVLTALIREILSSSVLATIIDLTVLLLLGLVITKLSALNYPNNRQVACTLFVGHKENWNFCKLGEAGQNLVRVSLSHSAVNAMQHCVVKLAKRYGRD